METFDRKKHWENIYATREMTDVSWYQATPTTSLEFLKQFQISRTAKIIDIGGGDSLLVDHLLNLGYQNITVLDISAASLERAKQRLGDKAYRVKWIVADAATFQPIEKYEFLARQSGFSLPDS